MNIVKRAKVPTPKFFKILRTAGLALLAVSGSIVAAPVALPAVIVTVAGYVAVAEGVLSSVVRLPLIMGFFDRRRMTRSFERFRMTLTILDMESKTLCKSEPQVVHYSVLR